MRALSILVSNQVWAYCQVSLGQLRGTMHIYTPCLHGLNNAYLISHWDGSFFNPTPFLRNFEIVALQLVVVKSYKPSDDEPPCQSLWG